MAPTEVHVANKSSNVRSPLTTGNSKRYSEEKSNEVEGEVVLAVCKNEISYETYKKKVIL